MFIRRVSALCALIAGMCVLLAIPAFTSNARIVRLSYVDGTVNIDRATGQGIERAILNMPVTQDTRIEVGEDGRAEVEFENGSTLRVSGTASIVFRQLSLSDRGDKTTLVDVDNGLFYFDIKHKRDDDFRIWFSRQTISVNNSAHFRLDASETGSRVAVFKGELDLQGRNERVVVKKNETVRLDPVEDARYYVARGIDVESEDSWDRERLDYRDRYAKSDQSYRYANSYYGAPFSYGMADLSYYGRYYNIPGYGWMWRPSSFGIGWDPFDNGAWAWYPSQGWVFVSTYPWGWTPYRYGQWVHVGGYGWCWSPARRYNYAWNPVPVARHWPSSFLPPRPPHRDHGPTVILGRGAFNSPLGPGGGHARPVPRNRPENDHFRNRGNAEDRRIGDRPMRGVDVRRTNRGTEPALRRDSTERHPGVDGANRESALPGLRSPASPRVMRTPETPIATDSPANAGVPPVQDGPRRTIESSRPENGRGNYEPSERTVRGRGANPAPQQSAPPRMSAPPSAAPQRSIPSRMAAPSERPMRMERGIERSIDRAPAMMRTERSSPAQGGGRRGSR
ncbi:MAG TPA: DUF6600 domain-containing protein [Clostridia bacterium]|nr:DUF6600 domain-containing protein [Clostridia bacterium]